MSVRDPLPKWAFLVQNKLQCGPDLLLFSHALYTTFSLTLTLKRVILTEKEVVFQINSHDEIQGLRRKRAFSASLCTRVAE